MANTKLKEVQDQLPTTTSKFEDDSGEFKENMRAEDQKIPFLKIANDNDPSLGIVAGDIWNNVTNAVYKQENTLQIVPVYFEPAWLEWPEERGQSGGPINIFKSEKECPKTERDSNNKDVIVGGNGNYIEYNHQHYCLVLDPETMQASSAIIAMKSTQLKKSRALNTMVMSQVLIGSKGPFNPPRFAYIYNFKSVPESNKKGNWHGWSISINRMLNMEDDNEMNIYATAKMFRTAIAAGDVEVKHEQEAEGGEDHDIF
tara:strand:+ start:1423 stop:2196 length:774 start_codon:yes stop_codon:yes gene_type:complete